MVWKIGDAAWICCDHHRGERTLGKIVYEFELAGWIHKHYVVEIRAGAVDWMLEVRDQYTMWRGPVGHRQEEADMVEPEGLILRPDLTPQSPSASAG